MSYQDEPARERAEKVTRATGESIEEGKERVDEFATAQSELLERLQDINRRWADRLRVEAEIGAEMATQLTSSRSFTDTANAIQNWTSKHLDMAADDTRRLLADTQQMMEAGTRFWASAGRSRPFEGTRGLMS